MAFMQAPYKWSRAHRYTHPKPTASYSLLNTSMFLITCPSGKIAWISPIACRKVHHSGRCAHEVCHVKAANLSKCCMGRA